MKIISAMIFIFLTSCLSTESLHKTYRERTSGAIGCLPDKIELSEVNSHRTCPSTSSWVAKCRGKEFVCSNVCSTEGAPVVNCKKRLK